MHRVHRTLNRDVGRDHIMKTLNSAFIALFILLGCTAPYADEGQSLQRVPLSIGMKRVDAERLIEQATEIKSTYDISAMDISSEVKYQAGTTILIVRYKPGSPSPLVQMPNGHVQDLPPIDGEVLSWEYVTDSTMDEK